MAQVIRPQGMQRSSTEKKTENAQNTQAQLQNQFQAAMQQLRTLAQQNEQLNKQLLQYQMTDYYQRASWLWTFIKDGKDLLPAEFIQEKTEELMLMFTQAKEENSVEVNNEEKSEEETKENEQSAAE